RRTRPLSRGFGGRIGERWHSAGGGCVSLEPRRAFGRPGETDANHRLQRAFGATPGSGGNGFPRPPPPRGGAVWAPRTRLLHRNAFTWFMLSAVVVLPAACSGRTPMAATPPPPLLWDRAHTQEPLTISGDGLTLSWDSDKQFAWLGSQTTGRLSGGVFTW